MYYNVGKKIQVLAKILGWVELLLGVVLWLNYLTSGNRGASTIAWICLGAGILCFCFSWVLCGFGQLVCNSDEIKEKLSAVQNHDELPKL